MKVACLVGAIKPAKDYHLAIDAAAELVRADPAWRVLFVGDSLAGVALPGGAAFGFHRLQGFGDAPLHAAAAWRSA